jgi:hypothetical protein
LLLVIVAVIAGNYVPKVFAHLRFVRPKMALEVIRRLLNPPAVVCASGTRGDPDGREGPRGVPVS